ncbi:MAG TPA: hypothetical protein VHY79_15765 [Rhizomicrobium sp.]|jgi:hypothetical protein|nr:hypothetical protein [Rhizomicrobium sp.]
MPEIASARLMRQVANIDTALDTFRDWLPTHGFKLVIPPPVAGGAAHAFASAWRGGEATAVSHKGATAALALLHATEIELVKLCKARGAAPCSRCRGVGCFITNNGTIEICRHAESRRDFVA